METKLDLDALWTRLSRVNTLTFKATSAASGVGWNGDGHGDVVVESVDSATLLFHEEGVWRTNEGKDIRFTNVYRWSSLPETHCLRLEHLRFGQSHPVYLFDLKQTEGDTWQSIDPHVCREDLYTAIMKLDAESIALDWTIQGPTKNESVCYTYRSVAKK